MIDNVKKIVFELMKENKDGHGFDHIKRVFDLAVNFAKKENADQLIVGLAALLHDVDDYKIIGLEKSFHLANAKNIMNEVNVDANIQFEVLEIIKTMGYSKLLNGIRPLTLEGKIVSDADMCDAIGANGIVRTILYGNSKGNIFFNKAIFPEIDISASKYIENIETSSICHFFEKLLKLKDLMLCESGEKEAMLRHDFTVLFLKQFFIEENAFEWIEYLEKI